MSIDPESALNGVKAGVGVWGLVSLLISKLPKNPNKLSKEDEQALFAASDAYYATASFYDPDVPSEKKPSKWDLAEKWERVAILLRKYDPDLADKLNAKSEFWRSGGTWNLEAIGKSGIGLIRIKQEIDDRLIRKRKK